MTGTVSATPPTAALEPLASEELASFAPLYPLPRLELAAGRGARVRDAAGREYLDFVSGIAVNALTPQAAIATPALVEAGWIKGPMFEPLETMAEAALALCTADPEVLTGRIAFSLQLLVELDRPVRDLHGEALVDGWQPADLPAVIARQEADLAESGWPDAYTFGRRHSPRP